MDYHILDVYTLKSMTRDINREIKKTIDKLNKLREQKDIINIIVSHRKISNNYAYIKNSQPIPGAQSDLTDINKPSLTDISDDTLIDPL